MIYTIENDIAVLSVDTYACEISSFKRKDKDIEYMWKGDPKYWSGRNPTLFPHVSSTSNKIINFKGKDYKVNNHGFCRKSEFSFLEKTADSLCFELKDNEDTLKEYPYHFTMKVRFTLKKNRVYIDYHIVNNDEDKLYFGFGQHPAFNCPLTKGKRFDDYYIEFEKNDVDSGRLNLSYELFEKYPTYVIDNPESKIFTLSDGENMVRMYTDDKYKIFAIWTPHAPFVCLEPWVNTIKSTDLDTPFEQRKGNIVLDRNTSYDIGYSFEII